MAETSTTGFLAVLAAGAATITTGGLGAWVRSLLNKLTGRVASVESDVKNVVVSVTCERKDRQQADNALSDSLLRMNQEQANERVRIDQVREEDREKFFECIEECKKGLAHSNETSAALYERVGALKERMDREGN